MKVVIGLSGGMDSATLLGWLLDKGHEVHCCTFTYGSKHNPWENRAASDLVRYYKDLGCPVHHHTFDMTSVMSDFKSALMANDEEPIPEGHYAGENMRKTVVPGRNLILAAVMAGLAESIGAEQVHLGTHSGDHHIYPDCRPEFSKALDLAVYLSSDKRVSVHTPFANFDKQMILMIGYGLSKPVIGFELSNPVPYHLTRTCYKDQEISCGKCGSCVERLEAFDNLGVVDPIPYE